MKKKVVRIRGKQLASLSSHIVVARVGNSAQGGFLSKRAERAPALISRVALALEKPGLARASVFGRTKAGGVFAYSLYPKDPTKVIRESAAGKRTVGRLVSGKFKSE